MFSAIATSSNQVVHALGQDQDRSHDEKERAEHGIAVSQDVARRHVPPIMFARAKGIATS